jgi:hypothetical protein
MTIKTLTRMILVLTTMWVTADSGQVSKTGVAVTRFGRIDEWH